MTDNSGALSIDFLIGFTIFILAFIWVSTMIPNLFIGLSSHTIDYDAVAYRTGVILAEDGGATSSVVTDGSPWEVQNPVTGKDNVARFGLAISKDSPNILDETKVERFFNQSVFTYPDDYRKRAIFGDYPYRFNISLKVVGENNARTVGDIPPEDHSYGYIRRDVKLKGPSNATINAPPPSTLSNETFNLYSMMIDSNELRYGKVRDPAFQIIPQNDRIMINITNLTGSLNVSNFDPAEVNLTKIQVYQRFWGNDHSLHEMPSVRYLNITYEDGNTTAVNPPVQLKHNKTELSNVTLIFERRMFSDISDSSAIFINLTFGVNPPQQYLNNSKSQPFNYNYTSKGVTPPRLTDGVLEVAVW